VYEVNKELAEFYGILLGDGCISRFIYNKKTIYIIRIDGNSETDKEYYNYIKKLVKNIIDRDIKIAKSLAEKCMNIAFFFFLFPIFMSLSIIFVSNFFI
jgi:hypothetical protein